MLLVTELVSKNKNLLPALERTGEVQGASPDAGGEAVIGEPERARHSLIGEAGGCGHIPGAAEVGLGIAADR